MARATLGTVKCIGCGYPLPIPDSGETKVRCPSCKTVNIVSSGADAPADQQTKEEDDQ